MSHIGENINEQFHAWEMLGGGGLPPCDLPVTPEPPFRPFSGYRFSDRQAQDDGQRHTGISGFLAAVQSSSPQQDLIEEEESPLDFQNHERDAVFEIQSLLPKDYRPQRDLFQSFLVGLRECREPLAFELVGTGDQISIQFAAAEADANFVRGQAEAYFPDAVFSVGQGQLEKRWIAQDSRTAGVCEAAISKVLHFPMATGNADPLISMTGVLSELDPSEVGVFQVLFEPVRHPWAESILATVINPTGTPVFEDFDELVQATRQKISHPLFGVVIRFAATSLDADRCDEIIRQLFSSLELLSTPGGNSLRPLETEEGSVSETDFLLRRSRRFGMLLNLEELSGLVHFPPSVHAAKLIQAATRTKAAPAETLSQTGLELGENVHRDRIQIVSLKPNQRVRHMHLIGASGTGKSNLMLNLIRQDIANGEGLAVLDPHGDLIDRILETIPKNRADDVILLDPSDEEFPIGFNILSAHSGLEKTLLASDLCSVFRRLATSWGDQMTAVFSNAILAFLESTRGGTLADLRRFLVEKPFREEFLPTVQDPEVIYFWQHEYPLLSGRPEGSVVTRLNTFLRPKPIRYMVSQRENRLDFTGIMDEGKILLARIPHGLIGEENAHLLGSLLVVKFHQLVMGRQSRQAESRRPFWLYIDEFHHFMTASMASILSGARKYNLGLILAHQDLQQLEGRDRDVASAVISNAYTRVCFRLGDHDARKMEDGFSAFDRNGLQSLGTGEAVCRVGRAEHDFNLAVPWQEIQSSPEQQAIIETIQAQTHKRYTLPRADVEAEISKHRPEFTASKKPSLKEADASEPKPIPTPLEQPVSEQEGPTEAPQPEILPPKPTLPVEKPAPSPGRGGPEHKALQSLVKQLAEGFNYRVTVEKQVLDGKGFVDLVLERGDTKVAVEISITTPVKKEIQNLRKCLEAGFDPVVMLSPDRERLDAIKKAATGNFDQSELDRISFSLSGGLAEILQRSAAQEATSAEVIHKGYQVKASFQGMSDMEERLKRQSIQKSIRGALQRLKVD